MKKILSIFLSFLLLFSVFYIDSLSITSKAETVYEAGHFSYTVTNNEATIVDYNYYCDSTLYIPSILGGYPVTRIGYHAFSGINDTKSIVIPEGIKTIDEEAFFLIKSLREITIPSSLESIGKKAFGACYSLSRVNITDLKSWCNIEIADIDSHPFSDCSYAGYYYLNNELINDLIIPDDVTVIKDYAFYNAKILSVTIPRGVTSIGWASLPDGNDMLEKVNITDIAAWCNIEFYDNPLYKTNLYLNDELVTDLVIPNEVININDYAFRMCKSIDRIIMPKNVTRIGEQSFSSDHNIDVYYMGSSKYGIEILGGNSKLQWHYNTCEEEHEYLEDCGTECNKCDWIRDLISEHTYSNVCDMFCNKCFEKRAVGSHIYDNNCDTECNECEATREITHTYSNTCDAECNICGFIRTIKHTYSNANDLTCNVCNESLKPSAPETEIIYANRVKLVSVDGLEYSIDGVNWQTDSEFAGLTPNTKYNFYQRVAESDTAKVSEISEKLTVTTKNGFTVSYDANGGINAPDSHIKTEGVTLILSSQEPERSGYKFYGWATSTDGKVAYGTGDEYITDSDVVLYAKWLRLCTDCSGDGKIKISCSRCGGDGKITSTSNTTCFDCNGKGAWCRFCGTKSSPFPTGPCSVCYSTNFIFCEDCGGSGKQKTTVSCPNCVSGEVETQCTTCIGMGALKELKQIAIAESPERILYSEDQNTLVVEGGKITLYYNDDSTETIDLLSSMISGYDSAVLGIQNLTVTYEGKSTTLQIIVKYIQTLIPSAPIISSFTDTNVTLMLVEGCEYSNDGLNWQSSNIFTGLSSGTKYTFYLRYIETEMYEASASSEGTSITTDKSKQTFIPNAPTVQSFTASSITLNEVDGCEYSKDGINWQSSNIFSGLLCGTEYTFYQRYKETETTYVSKSSEPFVVKTDKGIQSKPSSPTILSKTHNSVTLTALSGYEYSRDGINWQSSNVFSELTPETNYMFYQRKAETAIYYASEASAARTVKTDEEPTYTLGDIDGLEGVTDADAEYMLMYTFFPEDYPVNQECDFNGDGKVNDADAEHLLMFTFFPEDYPLH